MSIQHLFSMANDISAFFDSEAGAGESPKFVANHISRFWVRRMRTQLIAHAAAGGEGLNHSALEAVLSLMPTT